MLIRFSPTQIEFLQHRLEVPDCICQAIQSEHDDTFERISFLSRELLTKQSLDSDLLDSLDRAILEDCCSGSTWFACHGDETDLAQYRAEQTVIAATRKVSKLIGSEISPVLY